MSTESYLQCGWINPYHYEEPKDHMELAACAIISNLEGRAGINLDFDLDTRKEIVNEIVQIIDDAPAYFEKMQQHPNAGPEGLVDGK